VKSPYISLAVEVGVHFLIMYVVMYTMVNTLNDVYININNVYMTGMMVAPMVPLMIFSMGDMYKNRKLNIALVVLSVVLFAAFYAFMRGQSFVQDKQFVRSMIPHHSGAILMCEQSAITDPELRSLCTEIVKAQREEIEQMRGILRRLE